MRRKDGSASTTTLSGCGEKAGTPSSSAQRSGGASAGGWREVEGGAGAGGGCTGAWWVRLRGRE